MNEGFYKYEDGNLMYAPNFVCAPDYELRKDLKDSYIFPVDGWFWYESEEQARISFGINNTENF